MAYNRYEKLNRNGNIGKVPYVRIPLRNSDIYTKYIKCSSRLDVMSYDYYGSPDYDWLILMANPEVASIEFEIPDGAEIRIPYPLDVVLDGYGASIEQYNRLYGIHS